MFQLTFANLINIQLSLLNKEHALQFYKIICS